MAANQVDLRLNAIVGGSASVEHERRLLCATAFHGRLQVRRRRADPYQVELPRAATFLAATLRGGRDVALHLASPDGTAVVPVSGSLWISATRLTAVGVSGIGDVELAVLCDASVP